MRVVLDACILKLAAFPSENNASALISELARADLIETWFSPAILEEYADVLGNHPDLCRRNRRKLSADRAQCYPARTGQPVPGGALAPNAELVFTVNTAPGHVDRKQYQAVNVVRPGEFLNVPEVGRLKKFIRE